MFYANPRLETISNIISHIKRLAYYSFLILSPGYGDISTSLYCESCTGLRLVSNGILSDRVARTWPRILVPECAVRHALTASQFRLVDSCKIRSPSHPENCKNKIKNRNQASRQDRV